MTESNEENQAKGRRLIVAGGVLFLTGVTGFLLPSFLRRYYGVRSMESLAPLPPRSVVSRSSDMIWHNQGEPLLVLSSIGCAYCAAWERDELPRVLAKGISVILRDAPRTNEAVTGALFLQTIQNREERMRLRALAHQSVFNLLRDARNGSFGEAGLEGIQFSNNPENIERFVREVEGDRTLFHVIGTPTFARDGFRPLLGYIPADMLARSLGYS